MVSKIESKSNAIEEAIANNNLEDLLNSNLWCKRGDLNADQAIFISNLCKIVQPKYVLETGFATGRSAAVVLSSCTPKNFISLDKNLDYITPFGREMAAILMEQFKHYQIIEGDSNKLLNSEFYQNNYPLGLDWFTIDGDHSYKGCFHDLESAFTSLNDRGIMIVDDYKSKAPNGVSCPPVDKAVRDFCKHYPEVHKLEWHKDGKGLAILSKSPKLLTRIANLLNLQQPQKQSNVKKEKNQTHLQQKQHIFLSQVKEKLHNYQSELEQIKSTLDAKSISTSRQTFQEVEKNEINSFVKSSTVVVENYDADSHPIYDELFWGYKIEDIQEKTNDKNTINISGWVLGKKCPIIAIELAWFSSTVKKVSVDQSHPDIVKRYPQASQRPEIGFNIEFILKKLPPKFNWLVQAVFADETRIPIGCIQRHKQKSLNIPQTPLITKEAIQFLEKFFQQKSNAKVLEFGSGGSTIWISKLTKNLTSIEHDVKWFQQVKNYIEKQKNCHPVDFQLLARPYHTICEKYPEESFDLIIVDGRDRMKCFEASIKLLKPGGILMLDDAQREKYKQAHDLLKDWQFTKTVSKDRDTYWWEKPLQETTSVGKNQSISQQKQKSQEVKESVVIAGVSMVKDEEDIIYYTLAGNYRQGIKKFVMLDHMSSDGTRDEIRRFANDYPEAMVYLIEDRDPLFHKFRKMSAAAEFAHRMWGAEWIFPFDADEVMSSSNKSLPTILSELESKHICLGLESRKHSLRSFYDQSELNPIKRMTYRKKTDQSKSGDGYIKIIIRWQPGMEIGQGHHKVRNIKGKVVPATVLGKKHGLILREYRYRSREQIKRKIVNGGKAYEASPDVAEKCGGYWQKQYSQYKEKGEKFIDEFYDSLLTRDSDAIYDPAWE